MYTVNDDTKTAYKSDASHKELVVRVPSANLTLTNEDIIAESLELKEAIETSGNLSFQGCIAASFKIECFNLVDDTLEGQWIECDITADNTQTIPLFRGYISEVTNKTHEEFTTQIRAYDALYTINNKDVTSWYNSLSFPITVRNLRDSFFNHVGVTQKPDYLPNDGIAVQKTIEDKVIMGATIIKAICQINGRYGRIGRNGQFEYVHLVEGTEALYPREDLYPDDELYPADENALDYVLKAHYKNITFENYRVAVINKVQIIDKEGQIASTYGSGDNAFTLKDNPLVWGLSSANLSAVAINLYNTIQGLWYTPAQVECVGLPYVECGDFILMGARLSIVRAYVLSRTLKGIQALVDTFSADGDRKQPKYVPDIVTKTNANAQHITNESVRAQTAERNEATTRQNQINTEASTRQQQINNEANIRANQINAVNVRCDNLQAKDAQIENLVASKASIDQLNATNANVSNLSAKIANVQSLVANKANISDLQATNARVGRLESTSITTTYLSSRVVNIYGVSCTKLTLAGHDLGTSEITTGTGRQVTVVVAH